MKEIIKQATTSGKLLLFLCALVALAACYYFIIALPGHNRAMLQLEQEKFRVAQEQKKKELEAKAIKEKAEADAKAQAETDAALREGNATNYLTNCLAGADVDYWDWIRRNGRPSESEPGVYWAPSWIWEHAANRKKMTADGCYKQYEIMRRPRD